MVTKPTPPLKIDLGSNDTRPPGFLTVDQFPPADFIVDLRERWPWEDSTVECLRAHDIIEHLPDKIHTMNEAWRVLKPGGVFDIAVPCFPSEGSVQDPTHVSFWCRRSFLYFEKGNPARERFAGHYGVTAAFQTVSAKEFTNADGKRLEISLKAVK